MTREKILATTDSGKPAIIPRSPGESEFIRRLTLEDKEERMPYEAVPLSEEEIEILTRWVKEGANWDIHWAYKPIARVSAPSVNEKALGSAGSNKDSRPIKNEIDHFILKKLREKKMVPGLQADKKSLLRRLSLDLIGLPAPEKLSEAFLRLQNPLSYEELVDSLLASPHFGEKWASMWLDLARYADSKGYERDPNREMHAYRDYLIKAFNEDMPYDRFLTEQLAGDLLPNPTDAQYIATGFHRNTPTNDEGGTDNEEYRIAAVVDRVNTTGEALMGTTLACVQCHGHPYDPFEQKEYYQLLSFLNNTRDMDTHMDYPLLRMYEEPNQLKLDSLISWVEKVDTKATAQEIRSFLKTWQPIIYSIDTDSLVNAAFYDTKYLGFRKKGQARMKNVTLTEKNKLLLRGFTTVDGGRFIIRLDDPEGKIIVDYPLPLNKSWGFKFLEIPMNIVDGSHDLYLQYENPYLDDPEKMAFQLDWFYFTKEFPGLNDPDYDLNFQRFWDLMNAKPSTTLIMMENDPQRLRTTRIFDRGNWQVLKEEVESEVPKIMNPFPEDAPKNRLGLAQWLTDPGHPLTARTMVNRLWEQLFGQGLVETLEDFGTQGALPTHPDLLDWLAYQYIHEYKWSTKRLLKEIVSSATYCRSSALDVAMLEEDPYNDFYARGPRIRLNAEQVRDYTLSVSGLLNPKLYGRSVMPYQPDGVWQTPYNDQAWTLSEGAEKYRRALYTFMKRSSPYPSMETFDVAPRQVCVSRRIRTNTPLQALVTLNDPVYVEAAKQFGLRMQRMVNSSLSEKISWGYEKAVGRTIKTEKLDILTDLYYEALDGYRNNRSEALVAVKELDIITDVEETAAMTIVANSLFNLDEYLMK